MDDAGFTVNVVIPTVDELEQMRVPDGGNVSSAKDVQTKSYCGIGHECSSAGYCEGGVVDCSYGYCNFSAEYGAYTQISTYIANLMVPFSAEVHLPVWAVFLQRTIGRAVGTRVASS
jgi:hypothetical protein